MLSGWGVGVSRRRRLHPCHAASVGLGQRPKVLTSPLGARRGECAKGTHLRGYRFIATNNLAQGVVSTL